MRVLVRLSALLLFLASFDARALLIVPVPSNTTRPGNAIGGGNIIDIFEAAASMWERRIGDPHTVTIDYGYDAGLNPESGVTFNTDGAGISRVSRSRIRFSGSTAGGAWWLDDTPQDNQEYGSVPGDPARRAELILTEADLGGGFINTERSLFAVDTPPAIGIGGAEGDLLTNALHEIGHAMNIDYGSLYTADLRDGTLDQRIDITRGPFTGTQVTWEAVDGGHLAVFLPDGQALMNSTASIPPPGGLRGAHRTLISDLDVVVAAELSNFARVHLDDISYVALPNFSSPFSDVLSLNGDAQLTPLAPLATPSVLQLTPDAPSRAGSAFLTMPFDFGFRSGFETSFEFRIGGLNGGGALGADGLAFVIHGDARGAGAIGGSGGGLGLGMDSVSGAGITPSLAIEFDTHLNAFPSQPGGDPDGNHIAFIVNGEVARHGNFASAPFALNSGGSLFAWIDFDPVRDLFDVYLSNHATKPAIPIVSDTIDLASLIGPRAFFGFTAATGAGFNAHEVLSWDLVVKVPEPASRALLVIGLFVLMLSGLTRKRGAVSGWPA